MPRFGDGGGLKELEESLFAVASLALKSAIWAACALTVAVSSAMMASFSAIKGKIVGPAPQARRRGREGHQGDEVRAHDRHCAGCGSSWKQNPVNGY